MALSKEFDPLSEVPGLKKMSPFVILAVVLVLLWIFSPFVIVGAGERGVVFNQLHGLEDKILSEGFPSPIGRAEHQRLPVLERVQRGDRVQADGRAIGGEGPTGPRAGQDRGTAEGSAGQSGSRIPAYPERNDQPNHFAAPGHREVGREVPSSDRWKRCPAFY